MSTPRVALKTILGLSSVRRIQPRRISLSKLHQVTPSGVLKRYLAVYLIASCNHRSVLARVISQQSHTMATISLATKKLLSNATNEAPITANDDAVTTSNLVYPQVTYTEEEKQEINHWVNQLGRKCDLDFLNSHLSSRTTILGSKPSVADVAVYAEMAPLVRKWSQAERTGDKGYHHVVRHIDFVQNSAIFQLALPPSEKIAIDCTDVQFVMPPIDIRAAKARKKKEAEDAAASGDTGVVCNQSRKEKCQEGIETAVSGVAQAISGFGEKMKERTEKKEKKEKKDKGLKRAPAPVQEKVLSPAMIDLRVGHILKAIQHPDADSLYVSTIAMGDAPGTDNTNEFEGMVVRTVCSGLNGLIPLEQMQGRKIVAVCNLKPVNMRGVKSCAMVLAASPRPKEGEDDHKGPVELVSVPENSQAGDRIYFEGWEGEPESVLNPKKKIWETFQPGLTTTDDLHVGFVVNAVPQLQKPDTTGVALLRTKNGFCTVQTLKAAIVR